MGGCVDCNCFAWLRAKSLVVKRRAEADRRHAVRATPQAPSEIRCLSVRTPPVVDLENLYICFGSCAGRPLTGGGAIHPGPRRPVEAFQPAPIATMLTARRQRAALFVSEIITLVVCDEVDDSPLWKVRWLVQHKPVTLHFSYFPTFKLTFPLFHFSTFPLSSAGRSRTSLSSRPRAAGAMIRQTRQTPRC